MAGRSQSKGTLGEHRVEPGSTEREDFRSPVQTRVCGLSRNPKHVDPRCAAGPSAAGHMGALPSGWAWGSPPLGNGTFMSSRQLAMEHVTRPRRDNTGTLHGRLQERRGERARWDAASSPATDGWSPHVCGPALATASCAAWHTLGCALDGRPSFRGTEPDWTRRRARRSRAARRAVHGGPPL